MPYVLTSCEQELPGGFIDDAKCRKVLVWWFFKTNVVCHAYEEDAVCQGDFDKHRTDDGVPEVYSRSSTSASEIGGESES